MDFEAEIESFYDGFEREYGWLFTDDLPLDYLYRQFEQYLSGGIEPEEALDTVKGMIIDAGDQAAINRGDYD